MVERRDLPLFRWGEELRAGKLRRRRLLHRGVLGAAGVALLAATIVAPPAPRLLWNATPSAPLGLYWITPGGAIRQGQLVAARLPEAVRGLAAERRYLPRGVALVKRVAAIPGDRICGTPRSVSINGRTVAGRLPADRAGRPLPAWTGCQSLGDGHYLLLMTDRPDSFDGRYFGPSTASDIIGRAHLLWAR
jgi:conjugative transfer signal peptidase TraF